MAEQKLDTVLRHVRKLAGERPVDDATDRQLLERFRARRDEAAFAALVERHGRLVLSVCRLVLRHEQDAEDAFQATFLILARKAASIHKGNALANGHGAAHLWDVQTGKLQWSHNEVREILSAVAFAPDGKAVVGGGYSGLIWWDARTGKAQRGGRDHPVGVAVLAFSPDGKLLASGGNDERDNVYLWDASQGTVRAKLAGHRAAVRALAFTPDGKTLVTAAWRQGKPKEPARGEIKLWETQSGQLRQTLQVAGAVSSIAVPPDGRLLAVGGHVQEGQPPASSGRVGVWDLRSGRFLRTTEAAEGTVTSVAFAPDGRTLALGSWDGTVRVWDVAQWLAAKAER